MENRLKSIDVLRGLCVLLMTVGHMYYFWTEKFEGMIGATTQFIIIIAAPIFPLVSGCSYYLSINKRIKNETPKLKIFTYILKRSVFIFIISTLFLFIFGFIFGLPFTSIIYWSIFQVIAISMLVFFIIPFLKRNLRMMLYMGIFLLIFLIGHIIIHFKIESLYILISGGNFPFFPWGNFFLFGIFIGDFILELSEEQVNRFLFIFLSTGIILIIFFIGGVYSISYLFISIFFKNLGIFFIIFPILYYILDVKEKDTFLERRLSQWGRVAFSLYYIQFMIIGLGIILFPLTISDIYSNGFLFYQYLIMAAISVLIIDLFLRIWKKFDYILGIEWFMNNVLKKPFSFNKMLKRE